MNGTSMNSSALQYAMTVVIGAFLACLASLSSVSAANPPGLVVILDYSISMEDEMAGELKYKMVRRALAASLPSHQNKLPVGLITFGRKESKSCSDVERSLPLSPLNAKAFLRRINRFKPLGKSAIGTSLVEAARLATSGSGPAQLLLILDGSDNCRSDICATATHIARQAPQLVIHVLGLGATGSLKRMACISKVTNGSFSLIRNRGQLTNAIDRVFRITLNANKPPAEQRVSEVEGTAKTEPETASVPKIPLPPFPVRRPERKPVKTGPDRASETAAPVVKKVKTEIRAEESNAPGEPVKKTDNPVPVPSPVASPVTAPDTDIPAGSKMQIATKNAETQPPSSMGVIGEHAAITSTSSEQSAPVTLRAFITEGGEIVRGGLAWRIYKTTASNPDAQELIKTSHQAQPSLSLPFGVYLVNLSWGRSHLTEKLSVSSASPMTQGFVLNAGGLRLGARGMDGAPLSAANVLYRIYSDERDQFGKRALLVDNAPTGKIIRLNAGIYHITSLYGTVNGLVESDITVEAGKLTKAIVNHTATKVTFKLVNQPGGEALANALWHILSPSGETLKESGGALPTHILAAGDYTVQARYMGRTFARKITIEPGEPVHVEIVIQ